MTGEAQVVEVLLHRGSGVTGPLDCRTNLVACPLGAEVEPAGSGTARSRCPECPRGCTPLRDG